jgi:chromosome segregation protein
LVAAAEADIRRVIAERERLEQHTAELMRERKVVEESIRPLQDRLNRVNIRFSEIERNEHMANDSATRRANEADRWGIVEERYAIEMELAAEREKLEQVIAMITDDEHRYVDLEKEEALLRKRIETLESESKRRELARALEEATKTRATIANQIEKLSAERERSHALLLELGRKEAGYESRSEKIGELEAKARSAEELRRLATERYQLEKERHEIEMTRWKAEDDIALLEAQYQTIVGQLAEAEARRIEIERKIRDLTL